jgi:hypothetical protein
VGILAQPAGSLLGFFEALRELSEAELSDPVIAAGYLAPYEIASEK